MSDETAGRILAAIAELSSGLVRRLDQLEQGQAQLRTDLMSRMDRIQDAITAIRDDIGVTHATAERAREANEGTRNELRALSEVVSGMQRQIQRLQTDVRQLKGEP